MVLHSCLCVFCFNFNGLCFLYCGAQFAWVAFFVVLNWVCLLYGGLAQIVLFWGVEKGFRFSINRNCRGRPGNGVVGQQGQIPSFLQNGNSPRL